MGKEKRRWVRRPRVDVDLRDYITTHGVMTPKRGVIHSTECGDAPGTAELTGVASYWKRQARGYGAHVGVDKDGNSAMFADPHHVTYHTYQRNTDSIGIELIGFARFVPQVWWLRLSQLNKLAKWIAYYNLEYGIPIVLDVERGWSTHAMQSAAFGGDHYDPGKFFPLRYVIRKARVFREKGWT